VCGAEKMVLAEVATAMGYDQPLPALAMGALDANPTSVAEKNKQLLLLRFQTIDDAGIAIVNRCCTNHCC
jgi:hypothetical protein